MEHEKAPVSGGEFPSEAGQEEARLPYEPPAARSLKLESVVRGLRGTKVDPVVFGVGDQP